MNIKCIRLITGENIIGEVIMNLDGSCNIKNPLLILQQDILKVVLFPFCPFIEIDESKGMEIKDKNIMWIMNAEKSIEKAYIEQSTGLIIPKTTPNLTLSS